MTIWHRDHISAFRVSQIVENGLKYQISPNVSSFIAVIRRFSIWLSRVVCWQSDSRAIVSSRVSFRCVRESPALARRRRRRTGYRSPKEARHVYLGDGGRVPGQLRARSKVWRHRTDSIGISTRTNDRDRTTRSLSTKTGPRNGRLYRIVARSFAKRL